MCGDYNLRREKRYVEVDVRFTPDGKIRPLAMDMVRAGLRFNDFNTFLFAQLAQYLPYILFDLTVNYHSPIFRCKHYMVLTSPRGMA